MDSLSTTLILLTPCFPLGLAMLALVPALRGFVFQLIVIAALPALAITWIPADMELSLNAVLLGTRLIVDETSRIFAGFTALIWLIGSLYSRISMASDPKRTRYTVLFLLCMSGNLGMTVAHDFISFYSFYALMGFSAYGLIVHNAGVEAKFAGKVYISLVVLAEIALYAAVVLMGLNLGTINFDYTVDAPVGFATMACIAIAFAVKTGALPLHFSLPLIYQNAPPAVGLVLAGAMLNAGLLGWLRYFPLGMTSLQEWGGFFIILGLASAFYGVAIGLFQRNPRAILAYSSISQMGLMTIGLGSGLLTSEAWPIALTAVLIYALHHALAKSALFLAIDVLPDFRGKFRLWGFIAALIPALALGGMPLTSGAVAKTALSTAINNLPSPWPEILHAALPIAAAGTTWLVLRFLITLWQQNPQENRVPLIISNSWWVLILAVVSVVWLHPMAQQAASATLTLHKAWSELWPVLLGIVLAWRWQRLDQQNKIPLIPAGDILYTGVSLVRKIRPLIRIRLNIESFSLALSRRFTYYFKVTQERFKRWEWLNTRWTVAGTTALLVLFLLALSLLAPIAFNQ